MQLCILTENVEREGEIGEEIATCRRTVGRGASTSLQERSLNREERRRDFRSARSARSRILIKRRKRKGGDRAMQWRKAWAFQGGEKN